MSDQDRTEQASAEERFLGIKSQIGHRADDPVEEEESFEVNVAEEEQQEEPRQAAKPEPKPEQHDDDDDDELSSYSDKVQKRIKKLTYEKHEAARQRQKAEELREEAIKYAKTVHQKNQQYEDLIANGEAVLVQQIKARAALAAQQAEAVYRKAYEEGDTDKMLEAQKAIFQAQAENKEAEAYSRDYENRRNQYIQWKQQQAQRQRYQPQPQQVQQPTVNRPSSEAEEWAEENKWFGKEKAMTAYAYGLHEELVTSGVQADTSEYYDRINTEMRERFPDYFSGEGKGKRRSASSSSRSAPSVVASAGRNNGAKPSQVTLTPSQAKLAKRLGITNEQYAKQLVKGM